MVWGNVIFPGGFLDGRAAILHANAGGGFLLKEKSTLMRMIEVILFTLIISSCVGDK